jgi:hypothetical protein
VTAYTSRYMEREVSENRWSRASSLKTSGVADGRSSASTRTRSNRTFAQYGGIDATRLELMRDGSIDVRGFDSLMERLLTEDGTFVIDNRASTFIPLWS